METGVASGWHVYRTLAGWAWSAHGRNGMEYGLASSEENAELTAQTAERRLNIAPYDPASW